MKQVWQKILGDDYANWDVKQLQRDYTEYKNKHPLPYQNLIFPDVKDVLKKFRQHQFKIGLASSSTKSDILLALNKTGIHKYFDLILSGEEFPESKPNPAIYNEVAYQLGFPKSELLIIEDSEKGITAGVSAGIEVWAIEDKTFGLNQEGASRFISNLTEVADLLLK